MSRLMLLYVLLSISGIASAHEDLCFTRGNQIPLNNHGEVDLDDIDYLKVSKLKESLIQFWYSENIGVKTICYMSGKAEKNADGEFIYKRSDKLKNDDCIVRIRLLKKKASITVNDHCAEYCGPGTKNELDLDTVPTCKYVAPAAIGSSPVPATRP